jgi:hypothetical protein
VLIALILIVAFRARWPGLRYAVPVVGFAWTGDMARRIAAETRRRQRPRWVRWTIVGSVILCGSAVAFWLGDISRHPLEEVRASG